MLLKITLVTALAAICSSATPTYPEGKKSNQAVYSQSFNREDVPLSYKYSAVHVYSPNQKQEPAPKNFKNANIAGIQYAPLPGQYEEQQNEAGLYTEVAYAKDYSTTEPEHSLAPSVKTNHLEPKLSNKPAHRNPAFYNIPGHNIQVLQAPGHNPTTQNYHRMPQTERQTMGHYLEQFAFYEEPQRSSSTYRPIVVQHSASTTESPKISYTFVPKPQTVQQLKHFTNGGKLPQADHAGHMHPAKVPQLQLNIARDKQIHQQIRIAPAHISQARFFTYPLTQQIFVNPHAKKSPSDMAQLQPLPNHLHISAYSRT